MGNRGEVCKYILRVVRYKRYGYITVGMFVSYTYLQRIAGGLHCSPPPPPPPVPLPLCHEVLPGGMV